MRLTLKDKEFLERLRALLDEKELGIEMKSGGMRRLILRKNYGDRIESHFKTTRQGVRWRFHRLFNQIYPSAYETIYAIEKSFGTDLRPLAMEIVRDRYRHRERAKSLECRSGAPKCPRE